MNKDILHYYRISRQHQMETYGNSGLLIEGVDQRQFAGGGAAYGEHAIAAYWSARRAIHSRKEAADWLKRHRKGA